MSKKIEQFEDLPLWKNASAVAVEIYKLSEIGKLKSDFGMKDQIRRSAASISNNIAEGFEYNNNQNFIRFLHYAKGSAGELRSQLFLLKETELINPETYHTLYEKLLDLSKQISGFIKYLKEFEQQKKQSITKN